MDETSPVHRTPEEKGVLPVSVQVRKLNGDRGLSSVAGGSGACEAVGLLIHLAWCPSSSFTPVPGAACLPFLSPVTNHPTEPASPVSLYKYKDLIKSV